MSKQAIIELAVWATGKRPMPHKPGATILKFNLNGGSNDAARPTLLPLAAVQTNSHGCLKSKISRTIGHHQYASIGVCHWTKNCTEAKWPCKVVYLISTRCQCIESKHPNRYYIVQYLQMALAKHASSEMRLRAASKLITDLAAPINKLNQAN